MFFFLGLASRSFFFVFYCFLFLFFQWVDIVDFFYNSNNNNNSIFVNSELNGGMFGKKCIIVVCKS